MSQADGTEAVSVIRTIQFPGVPETSAGTGGPSTGDPVALYSDGVPPRPHRLARTPSNRAAPTPEIRRDLRQFWQDARATAEQLVDAARAGDPVEKRLAAMHLDGVLARMWDRRAHRDDNWQGILNHLQGMMKEFFSQSQVEALSPKACEAVRDLVDRYLGPATRTTEDLLEAVRKIEEAGGDPFAALSGDPPTEDAC